MTKEQEGGIRGGKKRESVQGRGRTADLTVICIVGFRLNPALTAVRNNHYATQAIWINDLKICYIDEWPFDRNSEYYFGQANIGS